MSDAHEHEQGLARFLLPERRVRFRESLGNARRRRKLLNDFAHFEDRLDPRFAVRHAPHTMHDGHVEEVHAALVAAGAPETCFVVASIDGDGQSALLRPALAELMWSGAGFLSCLPGELALYVGEDGSKVYILRRR